MFKCVLYFLFLLELPSVKTLAGFRDTTHTGNYNVTVFANDEQGIVSPLLMGFNIVYAYEKDKNWQNGKDNAPALLKNINTKILRYPGGTVVTFNHWDKLTGQGWADIWNPAFDASKNSPPSDYMDLDEYLALTKKINTEPLLGINMGSGKKYNRVKEGIEDAKRLMKYCISKGVKVKYYYLDNEPYQPDANFTFTADEYAESVNQYATEMKKIDPAIKLIVNTHPGKEDYTRALVSKAGKNIDYVDVHYYWRFKNATFANWKAQPKMTQAQKAPYSEQRNIYKKMFAESGFPDIELVALEWNIGPSGEGNLPPTEAQAALMVAEQFSQFIQSGLYMSCFWPISTPKKAEWNSRTLLDAQENDRPHKVYDMFNLYADAMGKQQVKTAVSADRLITVAVKNKTKDGIILYMVNKNLDASTINVNLNLNNFTASGYTAVGFEGADKKNGHLEVNKINIIKKDDTHFMLSMPQFSFAKVTLTKK